MLVHLYEEYGEDLVHALDGMFAFALWDERHGRLLLARDRFGEKPLFLHEQDGELTFASELTALLEAKPALRELDPAAIDAFFVFGYVPGPRTIVPGVRQLPPAAPAELGASKLALPGAAVVDARRGKPRPAGAIRVGAGRGAAPVRPVGPQAHDLRRAAGRVPQRRG